MSKSSKRRKLAGKDMELTLVSNLGNIYWITPAQGASRDTVIIDKQTKEVVSADLKQTYTFTRAVGNWNKTFISTTLLAQNASVFFENNKLSEVLLEYDVKRADPKIIQRAAKEIKTYSGRTLQAERVLRMKTDNDDYWTVIGENGPGGSLTAVIGVQTGKLWRIENSYDSTPLIDNFGDQYGNK
nr:hypothetical protein [Brevibacillus laterosporus]